MKEAFKWIMQGLVAKELGGVAVVIRVGKTKCTVRVAQEGLFKPLIVSQFP